jgi:hypothetical protein
MLDGRLAGNVIVPYLLESGCDTDSTKSHAAGVTNKTSHLNTEFHSAGWYTVHCRN